MSNLERLFESDMELCIESLRSTENAHLVAPRDFLGLQLGYGIVQNVILKWHRELMILAHKQCRSVIRFSFLQDNERAGHIAEATYSALSPDTKYFSKDSSSMSQIFLEDHMITIRMEANDVHSLRASLNSYLRLICLCVDTLSDI